ncbi:hypothetical protein D3C76_1847450 [compost metagenome]
MASEAQSCWLPTSLKWLAAGAGVDGCVGVGVGVGVAGIVGVGVGVAGIVGVVGVDGESGSLELSL